ncbi:3-oxo-5-alpha-steroid 4-dehydrogenase family protein [Rhynchospora pubera]|uniref:Steroid 5-alpha-reductase DET2 n=1 Tax=Rhynchospora pubera TaxID=906938 RepID=A0AAV8DG43_9POAL|nr:3-oxo-5-alpha-steroid 4-dehydrogenase family protein [Rhynchospora pubera]
MDFSRDESLYNSLLLSLYIITPLTLLPLQFLSAPYGKHSRPGWGPTIPAPLAWFLMESPTLWLTSLLFPLGRFRAHPLSLFALSLFLLHYTHRTIIYPLRLFLSSKSKPTSPVPVLIAAFAFAFNLLNGYVQARSLSHYASYSTTWPWPGYVWARIVIGTLIFLWGMKINISSDRVLLRLKEEAKGGYKVPRGGWFELVSCPNYMGEMAEWLGWTVLTWSPAALGFFLYTFANLGPRARAHRRWYREKFGDEYPASRKAIVPFVY